MSAPATDLTVRVARKQAEAQDICSLELVAADGGALPAFEAGAHVDVVLPAAGGEWIRQYSLCNAPGETHRYLIAVLRVPTHEDIAHVVTERIAAGATKRFACAGPARPGLAQAPNRPRPRSRWPSTPAPSVRRQNARTARRNR